MISRLRIIDKEKALEVSENIADLLGEKDTTQDEDIAGIGLFLKFSIESIVESAQEMGGSLNYEYVRDYVMGIIEVALDGE